MLKCSICGSQKDVVEFKQGNICKKCIVAIQEQTKETQKDKTCGY